VSTRLVSQVLHLLDDGDRRKAELVTELAAKAGGSLPDVLIARSLLSLDANDWPAALGLVARAERAARRGKGHYAAATASLVRATALQFTGDLEGALAAARTSLAGAQEAGDRRLEAHGATRAANILVGLGRYEHARTHAQTAQEAGLDADCPSAVAQALEPILKLE
jgi:tetratricopeptide (TPR) repeat protein